SIFAILLRSSWWVSAAIAVTLLASTVAVDHPTLTALLFFAFLPFFVITPMAAWKQRNVPSAAHVEKTADAVRGHLSTEGSAVADPSMCAIRGTPEAPQNLMLSETEKWRLLVEPIAASVVQ